MDVLGKDAKRLHKLLLVSNPKILSDEGVVGGDVLAAHRHSLAGQLVDRAEWIDDARVDRAEHPHRMHHDLMRPKGSEGGCTERTVRYEHVNLLGVLVEQGHQSPRDDTVTAIAVNHEVELLDPLAREVIEEGTDGVLSHRGLERRPSAGDVRDQHITAALLAEISK